MCVLCILVKRKFGDSKKGEGTAATVPTLTMPKILKRLKVWIRDKKNARLDRRYVRDVQKCIAKQDVELREKRINKDVLEQQKRMIRTASDNYFRTKAN